MRAFLPAMRHAPVLLALLAATLIAASASLAPRALGQKRADGSSAEFPPELVDWMPYAKNPVFTAAGAGHWDVRIRERGWILREDDAYHLWFTGYDGTREGIKLLGYATSPDGVHWKPSGKNPLLRDRWVEDMMVVRRGETYYMFAEGPANGHAVLLTSNNRVDWKWEGPLDIRQAVGERPVETPSGTPTVWIENGVWYLFYERLDEGVWLAKSNDPLSRVWTNIMDDPVLLPGPDEYDGKLIALNQVIKLRGAYYAFYHGSGIGSRMPRTWTTNIARSEDLVHWKKFPGNPIVDSDRSSGIVVPEGRAFRLYTMHAQVELFCPRRN